MIARGATNVPRLLKRYWRELAAVLAIVLVAEQVNDWFRNESASLDFQVIGLLAAALSIFLVFRVNEAYGRWWEARILWGGIVNSSRTFARQSTSLLNADRPNETPDLSRELVYRHVAYINALRMSLRRQDDWRSLGPWLDEAELETLLAVANKPAQLLQKQGERLADAREAGLLDGFGHLMLDHTLTDLCNLQGGCERIKNTVFPDRVAYFTQLTAWSLAVLIPMCAIRANGRWDIVDLIVVPAIVMAVIITERLGAELKNPFENLPNDTAMSAICRTIEIDLRQQLGETDVPTPLEPVDGVLM